LQKTASGLLRLVAKVVKTVAVTSKTILSAHLRQARKVEKLAVEGDENQITHDNLITFK